MAERVYTVSEALEILKGALRRCGLRQADVTISEHNLTSVESCATARNLIIGGFGNIVIEEKQKYRYPHRPGRYSWVTVEQGVDKINLFYDLQ